ncbi:UNVERIFIED_CONTAM: hypothetical protein PYX00_008006 [Menopon gallinae]|uniref:Uncharacterized protein n=1 Tax=Menopon gallinae TaxID=328185 RepID=A0AAW2HLH7_9NEOP
MYRKYTNSGKSSRNERLAQLSEQESVIERKKKEILAKLEAQKKKETEEALKKLEPQSSFKKDNSDSFKKHNWSREKEPEEKTPSNCPRNAFSNDGSFLDQFKKMSGSGASSKNIVPALSKRKEQSSMNKDSKETWIEPESGHSSKYQDSDSSSLRLDPQHSPKSNVLGSFDNISSQDDVQSKTISSSPFSENSHTLPHQSNSTSDNGTKNISYPTNPISSAKFQGAPPSMPVHSTPSPSPTPYKTESSFETDISTRRL